MKILNLICLLLSFILVTEPVLAQHTPRPRPTPSPRPSPSPRPMPNPRPTPAPRPMPNPRPTPAPRPMPNPRPIPAPRPRPIPAPRPRPIPRPIPAPRPYPIPAPIPRPLPTQYQACFYEGEYFQGRFFCVRPGESIRNLAQQNWSNRISSAIIPHGFNVTAFDLSNYGGESLTLYGEISSLSMYGNFWNNRITSLIYR